MDLTLALAPVIQNQLLLCDNKSTDPEDVRTEKKIELITLHSAMKRLDKELLDYSAVVDPLLAEQGPALVHIPRLTKTIQRLEKLRKNSCWSGNNSGPLHWRLQQNLQLLLKFV